MDNCPACGVSLIGEPIPEKDREFFGGETHFGREIGIYDERTDRTVAWECPDCKHQMSEERRAHITDGSPCWCGPNYQRVNEEGGVWVHREIPNCPTCALWKADALRFCKNADFWRGKYEAFESSPLRQAEKAVIEAAKLVAKSQAIAEAPFLGYSEAWADLNTALSRLDEGGK